MTNVIPMKQVVAAPEPLGRVSDTALIKRLYAANVFTIVVNTDGLIVSGHYDTGDALQAAAAGPLDQPYVAYDVYEILQKRGDR